MGEIAAIKAIKGMERELDKLENDKNYVNNEVSITALQKAIDSRVELIRILKEKFKILK